VYSYLGAKSDSCHSPLKLKELRGTCTNLVHMCE
jgi:hypothetical protein